MSKNIIHYLYAKPLFFMLHPQVNYILFARSNRFCLRSLSQLIIHSHKNMVVFFLSLVSQTQNVQYIKTLYTQYSVQSNFMWITAIAYISFKLYLKNNKYNLIVMIVKDGCLHRISQFICHWWFYYEYISQGKEKSILLCCKCIKKQVFTLTIQITKQAKKPDVFLNKQEVSRINRLTLFPRLAQPSDNVPLD